MVQKGVELVVGDGRASRGCLSSRQHIRLNNVLGISLGLLCIMGAWGASRGGQGGVGSVVGHHCGWGDWQSRSVECMMCSDECACMTSHNGISWAMDGISALFTAC